MARTCEELVMQVTARKGKIEFSHALDDDGRQRVFCHLTSEDGDMWTGLAYSAWAALWDAMVPHPSFSDLAMKGP